jgi:colanic acid biosynthesis glycosyl transferase WcaI
LPKENNPWKITHQLDGKFVVMYSGNIALTQGLETVVAAAALLRHIPDITFVIAGEAIALSRLQEYCLSCKADNVLLLPLQPRKQLPQMLAAADVGLIVQKRNVISFNMPSKIPLLLASGRPIIGSVPANGTAAKAISESGGGIIVEPESADALADAVLKLYYHQQLGEQLGKKGRQFALEHYAFEPAIAKYEGVFMDAITKHRLSGDRILKINSQDSVEIFANK